MIKGILFDLDGTLCDTLPALMHAMNITRARFFLPPLDRDGVLYGINDGPRAFVARTFPENTSERVIDEATAWYIKDYRDCFAQTRDAFPGMRETIAALHRKNIKTGVLTNKEDAAAHRLVEQIFGKGTFDPIRGVVDTPLKPDPAAALAIAADFGAAPRQMCFVGDSHIDMQTGKNAGMHTIGVSFGYKPVEVLLANGAEHIINAPEELLDLVEKL